MRVFDPWCWQSCYSAQNLSTFPLLVFLQILLSMEYFSTYTFKVQFIKTISRVMICWRTFASIILLDWGLFNGYVLSLRVLYSLETYRRAPSLGVTGGCISAAVPPDSAVSGAGARGWRGLRGLAPWPHTAATTPPAFCSFRAH